MDDRSVNRTTPRTTPGEFINQVKVEADKVVWPSRQETVTTAIFVAMLMVTLALFFLGVDSVFGALVKWLLSLAS
ncbi:MAG: preprotein translocase subunit SecE [Pseudomonadota bacterium]|nr:preprotein translocase subunit SecE [Pseudomonadota bacterium]